MNFEINRLLEATKLERMKAAFTFTKLILLSNSTVAIRST